MRHFSYILPTLFKDYTGFYLMTETFHGLFEISVHKKELPPGKIQSCVHLPEILLSTKESFLDACHTKY
jgi:hypothetical protein